MTLLCYPADTRLVPFLPDIHHLLDSIQEDKGQSVSAVWKTLRMTKQNNRARSNLDTSRVSFGFRRYIVWSPSLTALVFHPRSSSCCLCSVSQIQCFSRLKNTETYFPTCHGTSAVSSTKRGLSSEALILTFRDWGIAINTIGSGECMNRPTTSL
jgi:hypothetical protein